MTAVLNEKEEHEKQMDLKLEGKQIVVDALRKDYDAVQGPMRQYRLRHMRTAIRAKVLHLLMNTYF